jgi:hypothetical protein
LAAHDNQIRAHVPRKTQNFLVGLPGTHLQGTSFRLADLFLEAVF